MQQPPSISGILVVKAIRLYMYMYSESILDIYVELYNGPEHFISDMQDQYPNSSHKCMKIAFLCQSIVEEGCFSGTSDAFHYFGIRE